MREIEPINKVSIVIPVWNEQQSLPELLRRLHAVCLQLAYRWEIILVDDGSDDHSPQLLCEAARQADSGITAVLLNRNYGQHAAIMAGFAYVSGDLIITLDADLQNPPRRSRRLSALRIRG